MKTPLIILALGVTALGQQSPYEMTIEAFVDGPSTIRVTRTGFYWHNGPNAKPGRLNARNEPTYVNGRPWMPKWRKPNVDRGDDTSDTYPWNVNSIDLTVQILAVARERGQTTIESRKDLEFKRQGNEYWITIPDPEPGGRWYKFTMIAPDPLKPRPSLPK